MSWNEKRQIREHDISQLQPVKWSAVKTLSHWEMLPVNAAPPEPHPAHLCSDHSELTISSVIELEECTHKVYICVCMGCSEPLHHLRAAIHRGKHALDTFKWSVIKACVIVKRDFRIWQLHETQRRAQRVCACARTHAYIKGHLCGGGMPSLWNSRQGEW